MRNSRQALRVSETALIIQGQIESLDPAHLPMRDELVAKGVPHTTATELVNGISVYFRVTKHSEEYVAEMVAQGFAEKTVRHLINLVGEALDNYPEISFTRLPQPRLLNQVIDLCASGISWNEACSKAAELADTEAAAVPADVPR